MACDTPVMTSDASCLPEVAGDAALLVNPFSETDIAEGLEKLFVDRDFAKKLIENGRVQRQKFSWDVAAEQIYSILIQTAKRG